jgi:hypothetical protein
VSKTATRKKRSERDVIRLRSRSAHNADEIIIIGEGVYTYVWIGNHDICAAHFSGRETLRKIAQSILDRIDS